MASTFTLSGDVADLGLADYLVGPGNSRKIKGSVRSNLGAGDALIDTTTGLTLLGDTPVTIASDGTWSVTLIDTAATDLNVDAGTLQYELVVEYTSTGSPAKRVYRSGWFALTADTEFSALDLDIPSVTPSWRSEFVAEMEALRDEAATVSGLTGEDAAVALLIDTPASDTAVALSATIGTAIEDSDYLPATFANIGRSAVPDRRREPKLTMLAPMVAGHAWATSGGTGAFNANDTADFATGTRSVSYTTVSGELYGNVYSPLPTTDMTGKGLVLWLKVVGGGVTLAVDLGDASFTNYFRAFPLVPTSFQTHLSDGGWHPLYIPWSEFWTTGGTPSKTAIAAIRIRASTVGGVGTLKVGGVATYVEGDAAYPNGVVSFTFDDSWDTQWSVARPKLSQYGYAATLFPIPARIDTPGFLTTAQVAHLRDVNGWEIGAHCMTNAQHVSVIGQTAAQVEQMMQEMRAWQAANGHHSLSMAWPIGPYDEQAVNIARKYYRYARTNEGWTNSLVIPNQMGASAHVLGPSQTLANAQARVTRAIADKTWVTFAGHDFVTSGGTGNAWTPADFNALVDFIAASGIAVAPVADVMALR